jgi:hypothetical protein
MQSRRHRVLARYQAQVLGFSREGDGGLLLDTKHKIIHLVPFGGRMATSLGYPPVPKSFMLGDVSLYVGEAR